MAKKLLWFGLLTTCLITFTGGTLLGAEKATPQEVYDMILKSTEVVQALGDDGLQAFNDPKGEFVWKDTYVFVIDSSTMKIAAHPKAKRIGVDISNNQDRNPDPAKRKYHNREMVEIAKNPNGGWVEYYWGKLGDPNAARKISFVLQVPETPYVLVSGIYNENVNVSELNQQLQ